MKTLKSMMLGLMLLTVCVAAKAADGPSASRLSKNYAINTYIDIVSRGRMDGANDVFDPTAKFSMLRGKKLLSYTKAEMLSFMNNNQGIEQNCTVNTSVVQNDDNVSIVKVDMQYDGFVRSNYVTMANTGDGWKITNVYSVFK